MTATIVQHDTPRIWIGSLADYNAGRLIGEWVDATDLDEMYEALDRVLAQSKEEVAEEYYIGDHENFGDFKVYTYEPLDILSAVGEAIDEHGPAVAAWIAYTGDQDYALATFDDAFCGKHDSEKDFAYDQADAMGIDKVPAPWRNYIDWDLYARDLFCGQFHAARTPDYRIWVFDTEAV